MLFRKLICIFPSNRMTAIVGHSGAGKSTLVDVVMGLLKPESGRVMIDGIPLTDDTHIIVKRVFRLCFSGSFSV